MKAILIVDMPKDCDYSCPLYQESGDNTGYCMAVGETTPNEEERPNWCPLIPLSKDSCRIAFDDEDETVVYIRTYKNAHDKVLGEVF